MDFGPTMGYPDNNPNKITYTVLSPGNLYHTVMYRDGLWYVMENLTSDLDDRDLKWYTIRKLRQLMLVEVEGKWGGFEWVPFD